MNETKQIKIKYLKNDVIQVDLKSADQSPILEPVPAPCPAPKTGLELSAELDAWIKQMQNWDSRDLRLGFLLHWDVAARKLGFTRLTFFSKAVFGRLYLNFS